VLLHKVPFCIHDPVLRYACLGVARFLRIRSCLLLDGERTSTTRSGSPLTRFAVTMWPCSARITMRSGWSRRGAVDRCRTGVGACRLRGRWPSIWRITLQCKANCCQGPREAEAFEASWDF
jgi:hypothetical protein